MSTLDTSYVSILVDMGFPTSRVEKALLATGNKGVEPAMDWLLSHPEETEDDTASNQNDSKTPESESKSIDDKSDNNTNDSNSAEAKSLKCDVCGKLFKSSLEVEYHATKSGHDSFSESLEEKKALTEEEKRAKLKELEEKLKQKRREREEFEQKESYEKEKIRIKSGKEMAEARKKMEELEMKKILEQRKREKEEDILVRQAIRAQIEADKAARRAKAVAERGENLPATPPIVPAPTSATPAPKRDYSETRLQIRSLNGDVLTQNFGVKEQLSAVRFFIEINVPDLPATFDLLTTFPRKVFSDDDYDTPLDVLGLVPSGVIIIQKK